jgi:hypothetical protein
MHGDKIRSQMTENRDPMACLRPQGDGAAGPSLVLDTIAIPKDEFEKAQI